MEHGYSEHEFCYYVPVLPDTNLPYPTNIGNILLTKKKMS